MLRRRASQDAGWEARSTAYHSENSILPVIGSRAGGSVRNTGDKSIRLPAGQAQASRRTPPDCQEDGARVVHQEAHPAIKPAGGHALRSSTQSVTRLAPAARARERPRCSISAAESPASRFGNEAHVSHVPLVSVRRGRHQHADRLSPGSRQLPSPGGEALRAVALDHLLDGSHAVDFRTIEGAGYKSAGEWSS